MAAFQNLIKEKMTMNTKAVRIYGKNDLRLDDVELPEIGPDGVRVRITVDTGTRT